MKAILMIGVLVVILIMLSGNIQEGMTELSDDITTLKGFKKEPYPEKNSAVKLKDLLLNMKDSEALSKIIKTYGETNNEERKVTPTLSLNDAIDKLQYIKDNEKSE
jgi:hypothetical protein